MDDLVPEADQRPDAHSDDPQGLNPDPILLPPSKLKRPKARTRIRAIIEWVVVVGGAFGIALLIQLFLFQPFRIPSGSMIPTLQVRDRIVVNKVSYKLHDPHRGDVVVFTTPDCGGDRTPDWANCSMVGDYADLVKRIVALPGDRLAIADDKISINGEILHEPYVRPGAVTVAQPPSGCDFPGTPDDPYVIPDGMIFVMGDNRDHSLDSRCFGPIAESSLVGRAFVVIWPFTRLGWL